MDFCGKHFIYKINPQADPGIPAAGILLSDKSYKLSTKACPSSGYFSIPLLNSVECVHIRIMTMKIFLSRVLSYYNNALIL